jgi:DNA-binding transcriptional ArsR family regulator
MELEELLTWYADAPGDAHRLRSLASAMGIELTRRRLAHIDQVLGAMLAVVRRPEHRDPADARFQAGYIAALEDLLRSFQAELGEEESERAILHYVKTEPYRGALAALADGAETATEIAAAMGKHKSSASRALAALREAGLVAAFSAPDGNERLRPHALTLRGRRLVAELQGQRRGGVRAEGSRSSSSEKAAARKKTPGKGNKPASASAVNARRR